MLLLLDQFWPWLGGGLLITIWGFLLINLKFSLWVKLIINLLFNFFAEDTKKEKKEIAETNVEEVMSSNPGCILLAIGAVMMLYGLIRWWT